MLGNRPSTWQPGAGRWWYFLLACLAVALGTLAASLPERYVLLLAVLAVGLPLASVVIVNSAGQRKGIVLLLAFVPLTGILKAVTGSRFAPLTFDIGILLACAFDLVGGLLWRNARLGILDVLLGAFLGLALVQMLNPNMPGLQAGVEGFRKFAFMSVAFYAGRHIVRARDVLSFQNWLVLLSIPIALYGIKQFFFTSALDYRMVELATASEVTYMMGGQLRPFSTLPGPFHLGLYLVVTILLVVCLLMYVPLSSAQRRLALAGLPLQLIALFLTRTKGNWVGLVVGVAALIFLQQGSWLKKTNRLVRFAIVGAIAVLLVFVVAPQDSQVLRDAVFAVTHPSEAPTLLFRLQLWQATALPAMIERPLVGYGTGSAGEGLSNLYAGTPSRYFSSHNLYFKIVLEMGALGLVLFLLIVGASLCKGYRRLQRLDTWRRQAAGSLRWSLAMIVSFLVAGLVIPVLDAYPANYYFWLLLGLLSNKWGGDNT